MEKYPKPLNKNPIIKSNPRVRDVYWCEFPQDKALDARNRMSHTYSFKTFETVIESINSEYLALFDQLHMTLIDKAMAHE